MMENSQLKKEIDRLKKELALQELKHIKEKQKLLQNTKKVK